MPAPSLQQFNRLLVALYNGPHESSPWQDFLQQLCELLPARLAVINLSRPRPGNPGVTFIGGMQFDRAHQLQYANDFAGLDPFVNLPDGVAVTLDEMLPLPALRQTVFYREFMAPTDNVQVLGLDIYRGNTVGMFLRAMRGERAPRFASAEKTVFDLLAPHLRQLLEWLDRDRRHESERVLYDSITSRLEMGTILLDSERRIVHCNPVARHLLDRGDGLREVRSRLVADSGSENRQLQQLLQACCEQPDALPSLTEALTVSRADHAPAFYLLVKPLAANTPSDAPAGLGLSDDQQAPRAAVYISVPEILTPAQQNILQQLFDFTPSEARLAIALANGHSLDEIAEQLFVTRNTLRSHLRTAFQKAGVNQQSALVSLVLRSVAGLG